MRLTVDILETFVASLDLSGAVASFSDDGTNTTLNVSKTYHARRGMTIQVDALDYVVQSVVNNQNIIVAGVIASPLIYTIPNPFYFHGTPILTNAHISGAREDQKYPMIYLYEIIREKDKQVDSAIKRESDLRLFFLDTADFGNWETDDHYTKRLLGLNNLVDEFIDAARAYGCCFYLYDTEFTRINHANWGRWVDNSGHEKRIFDDDLSGVELSFTLPLKECN
jgi:hypothetical protein